MFNALTLAAGYIVSYCVHTKQGREMAKRLASEGMRQLGGMEKALSGVAKRATKQKKDNS